MSSGLFREYPSERTRGRGKEPVHRPSRADKLYPAFRIRARTQLEKTRSCWHLYLCLTFTQRRILNPLEVRPRPRCGIVADRHAFTCSHGILYQEG
ncbi:hypothetical protein EXIGLDRAFT_338386 [Exidia glandulosa HHB12029]|uniref:Uncharacterized protein n=1 Tax=Exidia glandulosa HHB12029 TaxID=1314781 RepID=A0A165CKB0_EXIGL|nr:hypothetical protein EXIGLDRAFT_338386 [Exidia glandulosa HHB12029]